MRKIIATIALAITGITAFAQNNQTQQIIKYVTHSPDGSVAITITDDIKEDNMKVESVDAFYKFQILNQRTSESVYTSKNKGKDCIIDTTNLSDGTYDLRLYTADFVITTDLEILRMGESYAALKHEIELSKKDVTLANNE